MFTANVMILFILIYIEIKNCNMQGEVCLTIKYNTIYRMKACLMLIICYKITMFKKSTFLELLWFEEFTDPLYIIIAMM